MTARVRRAPPRARPLAVSLLVFTLAASAAGIVFYAMSWNVPAPPGLFGPRWFSIAAGLTFGVTGGILALRRPGNAIGWLCLAVGAGAAFNGLAEGYALWALIEHQGREPLALWAAWVDEWVFLPYLTLFGVILALFPDGRWRSPRWRNVLLIACATVGIATIGNMLVSRLTVFAGHRNPIPGAGLDAGAVGGVTWAFGLLVLIGAAISAFARFRGSRGDERQQMKWLALAGTAFVAAVSVYGLIVLVTGSLGDSLAGYDWAQDFAVAGFLGVPVGIGVAVLKYRLYDIDHIVSRALGYVMVTAVLVVVYGAVVVGIGSALGRTDNPVLIAGATLAVAALFGPARRRIQSLIDRRFYRRRYDAERTLAAFASRLREEVDLGELHARLLAVVGETMQPAVATLWLRSRRTDGTKEPSWQS